MTDEERYIAQGRARDTAKELRAEVATLRTFFEEYLQNLEHAKDAISLFVSDPSGRDPNGRLKVDHVNDRQRELCIPGFFEKTAEFLESTRKVRQLEEQIKDF